jgi:serine/threonine protein kinase
MASLVAFAEAGFEPIPGYVLREKLGSGGFGEVWLADAPGGLKKAIKLVFGNVDDSRAANELKSLQRIRQVNHPFVLSLERIEIIDGQLIVVTELADCSLHDRFNDICKRGISGIPRDKLLRYLGDAADALDYICQHFELQHLDVKPANLLLVADRVKLADFGLIKDIQRTNNSLISGLTPSYAAPEMFDGKPCRHSDQYALAIVYQELLTGTFPFQGRTTAQLAIEHLNKAPNLDPLPLVDRPIIAKALSKKPSQRYSSCREMIDALLESHLSAPAVAPNIEQDYQPQRPRPVSVHRTTTNPVSRNQWLQAVQNRSPQRTTGHESSRNRTDQVLGVSAIHVRTLPPIEIQAKPTSTCKPKLFIGVGRTGLETLVTMRQRRKSDKASQLSEAVAWLGIDTDMQSLNSVSDIGQEGHLNRDELLHLPLQIPQYYKEQPRERFEPVSRRWLYNIPRSRTTEGVRALGLLAYLDNALSCYDAIGLSLANLLVDRQEAGLCNSIDIYIAASAHGGTGSAIASEIAFLVRRVLAELQAETGALENSNVTAVLTMGGNEESGAFELASASGVACLQELDYYIENKLHPGIPDLSQFPLSVAPVDDVYLIHGGKLGRSSDWRQAIGTAADFICNDAFTGYGESFRPIKRELRASNQTSVEFHPWLRTYTATTIELTGNVDQKHLADHWLLEVLNNWYQSLEAAANLYDSASAIASDTNQKPLHYKKTLQSIDLFCDDLFREVAWNAQAWVRLCFERLIPSAENRDHSEPASDVQIGLLSPETGAGVAEVQQAMNVDPQICQAIAHKLVDQSLSAMHTQIQTNWLRHHQNLPYVGMVLAKASQRLQRQSESLLVVSGRFFERMKALDDEIQSLHSDASPERDSLQRERSTLSVQKSVHYLASLLLKRLAHLTGMLVATWEEEIGRFRRQVRSLIELVAFELQLPIDNNGKVQQPYMPLPGGWKQVRAGVHTELDRKIASHGAIVLNGVCGVASIDCENASQCLELKELQDKAKELLVDLASQHAIPIDNVQVARINEQLGIESISDAIRNTHSVFLTESSAKRLVLALPSYQIEDGKDHQWSQEIRDLVSIMYSDIVESPTLIVDGQQMQLHDMLKMLWTPNDGRIELVKRLASRTDLDFPQRFQ